MYRDILTHKWILGGLAFLIVFSIACVWWYHYDTAPYRKAAAEAEELLRQSELSKESEKKMRRNQHLNLLWKARRKQPYINIQDERINI